MNHKDVTLNFDIGTASQTYEGKFKMPIGYTKIEAVQFYSQTIDAPCKITTYSVDGVTNMIEGSPFFGVYQSIVSNFLQEFAQEVPTKEAEIVVKVTDQNISFSAYKVQVIFRVSKP
jgi:hypothetical protein